MNDIQLLARVVPRSQVAHSLVRERHYKLWLYDSSVVPEQSAKLRKLCVRLDSPIDASRSRHDAHCLRVQAPGGTYCFTICQTNYLDLHFMDQAECL